MVRHYTFLMAVENNCTPKGLVESEILEEYYKVLSFATSGLGVVYV